MVPVVLAMPDLVVLLIAAPVALPMMGRAVLAMRDPGGQLTMAPAVPHLVAQVGQCPETQEGLPMMGRGGAHIVDQVVLATRDPGGLVIQAPEAPGDSVQRFADKTLFGLRLPDRRHLAASRSRRGAIDSPCSHQLYALGHQGGARICGLGLVR